MAQQQKKQNRPKQPQDPYAQQGKQLASAVQRLRGWVGSDPSRTPELADALVALTEHRLLGHAYTVAAPEAQESVKLTAQLLTANGPIGPYTSVRDAARYVTAVVHLAVIQTAAGLVEAGAETVGSLTELREELGSLPLAEELAPATKIWALSCTARGAIAGGDVAEANAYADAALQRLAEAGLRTRPEAAYVVVDTDRVVSDARWAAGLTEDALTHLHVAREAYDGVVDGRLAQAARLAPALRERLAEPAYGLYRDLSDRLLGSGELDLGLVTRRQLVELLRGLAAKDDTARVQLAGSLADLVRDLKVAGRDAEADLAAEELDRLPEPDRLAASELASGVTRGGGGVTWEPLGAFAAYAGAGGDVRGASSAAALEAELQRETAARLATEREAAKRVEAERQEEARLAAERREAERVDAERASAERAEVERVAAERLATERAEAERIEAERLIAEEEAERQERKRRREERIEEHRLEQERLEAERVAAEQRAIEEREAERRAADPAELERLELERLQTELAELERQEAAEAARLESERLAEEQRAVARAADERAKAEAWELQRRDEERLEAVRAEAARAEAAREAERLEAERADQQRLADEESARHDAERLEAERQAAERQAAEDELTRLELERIEADRLEQERAEREWADAEWFEGERRAREEAEQTAANAAARAEAERLEQEAAERQAGDESERLAGEPETEPARAADEPVQVEPAADQVELPAEQTDQHVEVAAVEPQPIAPLPSQSEPVEQPARAEDEPAEPEQPAEPEEDELAATHREWQEARGRGDRKAARAYNERVVELLRPRAEENLAEYGPRLLYALEELAGARLRSGEIFASRGPAREAKALAKTLGRR